mgnify:FL=1
MWSTMMAGEHPFTVKDGVLNFELHPALAGWLFDENGEVRFQMCSNTTVIYKNASHKNTYGEGGVSVKDIRIDGTSYGTTLTAEMAENVRNGQIKEMICELA